MSAPVLEPEAPRPGDLLRAEALSVLFHDLRGPLNTILGWSNLLRRTAPAAMTRGLDVVERNARVQAWLLEDASEVYRIAGGFSADRRPVDVAALTKSLVVSAREALGVGVELHGDTDHSLEARVDAPALRAALRLLVCSLTRTADQQTAVTFRALADAAEWTVVEPRRAQFPLEHLPALERGEVLAPGALRGLGLPLCAVFQVARAHHGAVRPTDGGLVLTLPVR